MTCEECPKKDAEIAELRTNHDFEKAENALKWNLLKKAEAREAELRAALEESLSPDIRCAHEGCNLVGSDGWLSHDNSLSMMKLPWHKFEGRTEARVRRALRGGT